MSLALRDLMGRMATEAERCIRCGFCNSVCPTTLIDDGYAPSRTCRGRLVLLQSALGYGTVEPFNEHFKQLIDLCFGCMRCVSVCPAGIPIPHVMARFRYAYVKKVGENGLRKGELTMARYYKIAPLLAKGGFLARWFIRSSISRKLLERLTGIASDAPLPAPEGGTLDQYFNKSQLKAGARVYAYFADTFARYVKPSIGIRVHRIVNSAGDELTFPEQTDSGITLLEYGLHDEFVEVAKCNVSSLFKEVSAGRKILCSSPAATLMLRHMYVEFLDTREARMVAENVVDINEYLAEAVRGRLKDVRPKHENVVLHSSCFSQALALTKTIKAWLSEVGCKVLETRDECCGVGGSWGFIKENRETSLKAGSKLFKALRGPVLSYSETCTLQISGITGINALLPFENLKLGRQNT